jgi:hypothetical protein
MTQAGCVGDERVHDGQGCDLHHIRRAKGLPNEKRILEQHRAYGALWRQGILSHLDNCLAMVHETEPGTSNLRDKLLHKDKEQFESALSEIEVIGRRARG